MYHSFLCSLMKKSQKRKKNGLTVFLICTALWYLKAGVVLELLVMEEILSFDPTRGSCYDFPFNSPGRTTFVLLLYLGHMGNLTGVVWSCYVPQKLNFFWGIYSKSGGVFG